MDPDNVVTARRSDKVELHSQSQSRYTFHRPPSMMHDISCFEVSTIERGELNVIAEAQRKA